MRKNLVLSAICLAGFCFASFAQETPPDDLVKEMADTRSKGDWEKLLPLTEKVIAHEKISHATKSQAQVYHWTALVNTGGDLEDLIDEAEKLEKEGVLVPMWRIQIYLEQAQCYGRKKEYELAIEKADQGIEITRERIEKKGETYRWDRIFLFIGAKATALRDLGERPDAAKVVVSLAEEVEKKKVKMRGGLAYPLMWILEYAEDVNDAFEGTTRLCRAVLRTNKPAEVKVFVGKMDRLRFGELAKDADKEKVAELKSVLTSVRTAFKDVKDEDALKAAADAAEAQATDL